MLSNHETDEIEKFSVEMHRRVDEGASLQQWEENGVELPWDLPEAEKRCLIDEKTILQAFMLGVTKAHQWPTEFYTSPPGFIGVLDRIGQNVQLLRFNFPETDGKIRMSLKEITDHLRIWMNGDEQIREWVKQGLLIQKCILISACKFMLDERRAVEEVVAALAPATKKRKKKQNLPPASQGKAENKLPSGLQPSISSGFLPAV